MSNSTPLKRAFAFKSKASDAAANTQQTEDVESVAERPTKKAKRWSLPQFEDKDRLQDRPPIRKLPKPPLPTRGSFETNKDTPSRPTRPVTSLHASPKFGQSHAFRGATPVASTSLKTLDVKPSLQEVDASDISTRSGTELPVKSHSIVATSTRFQSAQPSQPLEANSHEQLDPSPRKNRKGQRPAFCLYRRAEEILSRQSTDVLVWSQTLSKRSSGHASKRAAESLPELDGALKLSLVSFEGVIDCGKSHANPMLVKASLRRMENAEEEEKIERTGLVLLSPVILSASKSAPKLMVPLDDGILALYPSPNDVLAACASSKHTLWLLHWSAVDLPAQDGSGNQRKALLSNRYAIQKPP